jgi:hypothetical protein
MRILLLICTGLLLLALTDLPIGYFTFLRIVVTIGAFIVVITEYDNGINFWVIAFGLIAILFNPLLPVYFGNKSAWIPIDLIAAMLFGIKYFTIQNNKKND